MGTTTTTKDPVIERMAHQLNDLSTQIKQLSQQQQKQLLTTTRQPHTTTTTTTKTTASTTVATKDMKSGKRYNK